MPGFPDWNRTTAWTFPPTISDANLTSNFLTVTGDVTTTMVSYTDGAVHVLYVLQLDGMIFNTDTANDKTPLFHVAFSRGLDNGGSASPVLTYAGRLPTLPTGAQPFTSPIALKLTQPILFQAGSVATPNVLQFLSTGGQTAFKAALGFTVIDWAVS